jgi:hypothetical protein
MDLTPLIENDALSPADYVDAMIEKFRLEVLEGIGESHS